LLVVVNFPDPDLPPYRPETPFEMAVEAVWDAVTYGAMLLWIWVAYYVIRLFVKAFSRRNGGLKA